MDSVGSFPRVSFAIRESFFFRPLLFLVFHTCKAFTSLTHYAYAPHSTLSALTIAFATRPANTLQTLPNYNFKTKNNYSNTFGLTPMAYKPDVSILEP